MKNFIVTTDSGCDLPLTLLNELDILPLKMKYTIDGVEYTDSMDQSLCADFYDKMRSGAVPKTSQINPSEYIEFFTPLLEKKMPILHVSISSGISGTYANGITAINTLKSDYPDSQIYILDSTQASAGTGMLALKAAEFRDKDYTFEQAIKWLEDNKKSLNTYYTTGDLKYLRRSGRVNKLSAFLGTVLNINVIMKLTNDGRMVAANKIRGKKATMQKIHETMAENILDAKDQTLFVSHADSIDEAKQIGEDMRIKFGFKDVFYTMIGSTIGSHTGPKLISIFYYGKERTD